MPKTKRPVFIVSQHGPHDYMLNVMRHNAKKLKSASHIKLEDFAKARVDHADMVIFFDETNRDFIHNQIGFSIKMIEYGARLVKKGILVFLIAPTKRAGTDLYAVYRIHNTYLYEQMQIPAVHGHFDTHEQHLEKTSDGRSFYGCFNWKEFQRRLPAHR